PSALDGVLESTFDIVYTAFCTSGPAYVVIDTASIDFYGPDESHSITVSPLESPIVDPGESTTATISLAPVAAPGICQRCGDTPVVKLVWNRMPSPIGSFIQELSIDCTE